MSPLHVRASIVGLRPIPSMAAPTLVDRVYADYRKHMSATNLPTALPSRTSMVSLRPIINVSTNPEIRISQICICFMSAAPIPMDPTDDLITHITLSRAPEASIAPAHRGRRLIAGPQRARGAGLRPETQGLGLRPKALALRQCDYRNVYDSNCNYTWPAHLFLDNQL